ncbi:RagB/SusD family nutrient uptake outer membrane protein [Pedobacter frigidisoli]|uniref:RagB/SusD family nutrient uptake outer membrane protein n=1 Tax=Pedobacter frigidisoli TaxID=2530455 RepID=UPI00292DD3EC|nr:RagB/SusD family nutrient uptake outer membrane protein [Pedobacter frigidisoli]
MKKDIIPFLKIAILILLMATGLGCKKYLDEKPDQKLATIQTTDDMQALLDYYLKMNFADPAVPNACVDDYYVTNEVFAARSVEDQNMYLWKGDHNFGASSSQWFSPYEMVYICNSILDALDKFEPSATTNHIKAQTLFHRGRAFLNIIGIWTKPYNAATAATDLGIPLRVDANFNVVSVRASLAESYAQVLGDLKAALTYLPARDISVVRPSKGATYGMLSRTYLQMRDYINAGLYADSALQIQNTLMDFNSLTASANFPIAQQNIEVLFDSRAPTVAIASQTRALINPDLYNLYSANDLRKTVYFKASGTAYIFKGYYTGAASVFNGVATDEMLLTRAECYARANQITKALADLNNLLANRYKKGTFTAYANQSPTALLALIKNERRKELIMRTLRWGDIKRWNMEGDEIPMSRTINGAQTVLQPNSLRYALPFPEDVISLSGMPQNP